MTPTEAVAILTERLAGRLADEESCTQEIRALVPAVAQVLVREFGVRRVVLFGSVARGTARSDSDIDLAVAGLSPGQTFRAMARAAEVAGRDVDLVSIEDARPGVLAIIGREGEVIHDDSQPVGPKTSNAA